MRATFIHIAALAVSLVFLFGCGSLESPTIPDSGLSGLQRPVGDSLCCAREILWGLYDIVIDPASESVEIVPLRGVMFEANVTKFLQPPTGPGDLLSISLQPETDFPSGYVVVNVGIQHPFPSSNLRGFDVMGIFMAPEGDYASSFDPSATWPSPDQARLLNADGYTRWWNQAEFTSFDTIFGYTEGAKAPHGFNSTCILNPFKYFASGLDPDDPFDVFHLRNTERGSFATTPPAFLERRYEIQFPPKKGTDYRFKYSITSSYLPPYPGSSPPAPVDDYSITASRGEAAQISVTDSGCTAYYRGPGDFGGDLSFELAITDWQGTLYTTTQGEFTGIYAESPTLFPGTIDLRTTSESWEEPYDATLYMWCSIPDVSPTTVTNQEILITVLSRSPNDYSVQHPAGSGFDYPEGVPLAAYNVWEVPIKSD